MMQNYNDILKRLKIVKHYRRIWIKYGRSKKWEVEYYWGCHFTSWDLSILMSV